jgi:hypothetical protein
MGYAFLYPMSTHIDFATQYRNMTDDQLLQIASEGGLVDEATVALNSEMASRKLTPQAMSSYKEDQLQYKKEQVERANKSAFFRLFGRRVISQDDTTHRVEIRTKWFAPRGIPIFPIASYRYSWEQKTIGKATSTHERLIDRVPLNWAQVLRTGAITYGLIIFALTLFVVVVEWQNKLHGQ